MLSAEESVETFTIGLFVTFVFYTAAVVLNNVTLGFSLSHLKVRYVL